MEYNQTRIELGALATAMFYAAQKDRINAFNRIRQIIYRKIEGKDLSEKSDKKDEEDKYMDMLNDKQLLKYITENIDKLSKEDQEYINKLMLLLKDARTKENEFKGLMHEYIELEPIYDTWLKNVKGISTLNTANLLQYFGYCEKAKHCSSLWKYAGLHVVNGAAPKKASGEGQLDWNPKLRMLMYRVMDCFIKCRTVPYRVIYDKEKEKQIKLGGYDEKKKVMVNKDLPGAPQRLIHAELRARRKAIKRFLADYYEHCRVIRGLPPEPVWSHRNA